ncbi:hypothetical protein BKA56DRAFT_624976 [Ilyonectria sp. MPI-CAGE-AT-0026]|nr:hypothetical protein BKA56DRAFT_624976 [Ilyonectria sp. MPI-CAGE-AT-0026]
MVELDGASHDNIVNHGPLFTTLPKDSRRLYKNLNIADPNKALPLGGSAESEEDKKDKEFVVGWGESMGASTWAFLFVTRVPGRLLRPRLREPHQVLHLLLCRELCVYSSSHRWADQFGVPHTDSFTCVYVTRPRDEEKFRMIGDGAPLHYFVLFQQHVFEPIGVYHQHGEPWCGLLVSRNGPV